MIFGFSVVLAGPVNARTCPVNARVSIGLNLLKLPCRQFLQRPKTGSLGCSTVAGLSQPVLTTQYWQSELLCSRGHWAAAAVESANWSKFNLNLLWIFNFIGMLIPITLSFNVLSQILKLKFVKKAGVVNLKQWNPAAAPAVLALAARSCHGTCQSHNLSLAASLSLSCGPGIAVLFFALQQDSNARCWPLTGAHHSWAWQRTLQQFEMLDVRMEGLFLLCCCHDVCCEVGICFCTHKKDSLKVYQNRSLVLTTTSDRSWISDHGNFNDWYKWKINPKI